MDHLGTTLDVSRLLRQRPAVARSLDRAVDKDLLIDTLFSGRVTVSPVGGFYPNLTGWYETWVERFDDFCGYDPDRARELLAEAGYGPDNPAEMKMIVMSIFGSPNRRPDAGRRGDVRRY